MKQIIKYGLLTLVAIVFSGLVWLSNLSPVLSQATVQLETEPPLEQVIPDETVVKFQLQAIDKSEQPLPNAKVRVRILAPAKNPWFTSDFPIVEGTELLNLQTIASQGNLEFQQVLPIRGNYSMEVAVTPEVKGAFEPFEQSLKLSVPENSVKYRNLAILAAILLGVGFSGGWILGGEQIIRGDEIAPQPVRMLLSGMTLVAITVLLFVNLSAEVALSNQVRGDGANSSTHEIVSNQEIQVELSGDKQAMVGKLATQTVQVTNLTTREPVTDVQINLQSVALEHNARIFAYQGTPDATGKITWLEQFFDGAPHSVMATVTTLDKSTQQFAPLEVSHEVEVDGIAPPLFVRFVSLLYFTLIFVVGLIAGFWGRRRKTVPVTSIFQ